MLENLNKLRGQYIAKRLLDSYKQIYPPPLFIFHGPSGVGKYSAAEAFIRQKLCAVGNECGSCLSCRNFLRNEHPDYIRFPEAITPIGHQKNPEPFSIRWLLQTRLPYTPFSGPVRFILFPLGETIQHEAETALLKTLEEMPKHTRMIILTKNIRSIKATIISRGICVPFHLLSDKTIHEITACNDPIDLQCLGGSLDNVAFLQNPFYSKVKKKISGALEHPIELLNLEKWLIQFKEVKSILTETKMRLEYKEILEFFSLVLLISVRSRPFYRKSAQAILSFKQDLRMDKPNLFPYLISRLFAELNIIYSE